MNYADAIASIESSGNYGALGPVTPRGNRAYGRYQVMDFNIGPWSEKYVGRRMTPDEFLADPKAQDAVFNGEFGSYVDKYGNPQDAASAWFSGRPLSQAGNSSDGYTTVPDYVRRFTAALGGGGNLNETLSTSNAPAGLLGQPEQPRGLLGMKPDTLQRLSMALMAASGYQGFAPLIAAQQDRISQARQDQQDAKKANATMAWLAQQPGGNQYAQLADILGPSGAVNAYLSASKDAAGGTEYGLTPQFYVDDNGVTRMGVLGKDGTFKPVDVPGSLTRGVEKIDLGDRWRFVNINTGEVLGEQMKNLRDAAAETEIGRATGTAAGEAITGAGGARTRADQIGKQIDGLLADPYLPQMIGPVDSRLPNVSGNANRVQAKIDQVLGQAFLEGRQLLKGGGAITDFESAKAEQAFVRASTAQNEADFRAAMTEFRDAVRAGAEKIEAAAASAGGAPIAAPAPSSNNADPLGLR